MILYIDHFDSFANTIIDYVKQIDKQIIVLNTNQLKTYNYNINFNFSKVIVGPGYGHPKALSFLFNLLKHSATRIKFCSVSSNVYLFFNVNVKNL